MKRDESWIPQSWRINEFKLVSVTETILDTVTETDARSFSTGDWITEFHEINTRVGGTGVHVGRSISELSSWDTLLVTSLGAKSSGTDQEVAPDPAAAFILAQLQEMGIGYHVELDPAAPTGRAVILYPKAGGRLMLVDSPKRSNLTNHVIRAMRWLSHAKSEVLLYVSGYLFFDAKHEVGFKNIFTKGMHSWVDVLPHRLYEKTTFPEFSNSVEGVEFLSIDFETVEGFAAQEGIRSQVLEDKVACCCRFLIVVGESCLRIKEGVKTVRQVELTNECSAPGAVDALVAKEVADLVEKDANP